MTATWERLVAGVADFWLLRDDHSGTVLATAMRELEGSILWEWAVFPFRILAVMVTEDQWEVMYEAERTLVAAGYALAGVRQPEI